MSDDYRLCPNCRDRYMPPDASKCYACREQDAIDAEAWLDDDDFEPTQPCPHCNGTGQNRYDLMPCEFCDGEGFEIA